MNEWINVKNREEERMDDKTDNRMEKSTVISELEMTENVVANGATLSKGEVNEDAAKEESIDTTDKKSPKYNAKQANTFAAKKTVAQGMMDVALITANANQLRYLIEYQRDSSMFYVVLVLIIISLLLQVREKIY